MKTKGKMKFLPLLLSFFLVSCVNQRKTVNPSTSQEPEENLSSSPTEKENRILFLSDKTRLTEEEDLKNRFLSASGYKAENVTFQSDITSYPSRIEELDTYDQIILSDVDVSQVQQKDTFLPALRSFVEEKGKSLFTFGNVVSLDSLTTEETETSGEDSSSVEEPTPLVTTAFHEMLPLQYDYAASHAICLLIDSSGSMDTDNRMAKAKQGAIACLDYLSDKDYISVVTFSDTAKTVQSLTSAKNKDQVITSINTIKSEGGTEIIPGLKAASNQIADSNADYKSILLLSDGDPFEQENTIMRQVRNIVKKDVSISCINISNNSSAAIALLKKISKVGEGSYIYCRTSETLGYAMKTLVKKNLKFSHGSVVEGAEEGYSVSLTDTNNNSLQGITALPSLYGFDYATTRKDAKEILSTSFSLPKIYGENNSKTKDSSLFATWKFGNGFVSSFASSLGRKVGDLQEKEEEEDSTSSSEAPTTETKSWSKDFFSSSGGTLFLKQALKANRDQDY